MSNKDFAKSIIDKIPESRMYGVIMFLQGAAIPDDIPNDETIAAMKELDNGGGERWTGSTEDLFAQLLED